MHVSITEALRTKLDKGIQGAALLVGIHSSGAQPAVLVADAIALQKDTGAYLAHDVCREIIPEGLSYVGVCASSMEVASELLQLKAISSLLSDNQPCIVAIYSGSGTPFSIKTLGKGSMADQSHTTLPGSGIAWLMNDFKLVRCFLTLTLHAYLHAAEAAAKHAGWKQAIKSAFQELEKQLCDERVVYVAHNSISGQQLLISPAAAGTLGEAMPSTLDNPIHMRPMLSCSAAGSMLGTSSSSTPSPASAPVFEYHATASTSSSSMTLEKAALHLDVLCYVPAGSAIGSLGKAVLQPALLRQLQGMQRLLLQLEKIVPMRAYHFLLPGRSHHVTLVYPTLSEDADANEANLAPFRRDMHSLLGLPENRPALRTAMALDFTAAQASGAAAPGSGAGAAARLRDVHVGLPLPGIGGSVSMVSGSYDYYHYMQDRFNDSGWGCAYRSLQTICSWFRIQQYTNKPVPGHSEIQQILVKIGDKPQSFVGSSNWIGAVELSYVLDEYLGISSKIITINRGAEIPSKARELAAHFQLQGTPIMIGGGVLAYTLLGVQFNELTGECAFLILDPHYTAGEELRKIQQGTWVAWKRPGDSAAAGGPLFVHDAFYNFLCPQRPNTV